MNSYTKGATGVRLAVRRYSADGSRLSCKACGEPIIWVITKRGRKIPLEIQASEDGDYILSRGVAFFAPTSTRWVRYKTHLETCTHKTPPRPLSGLS